VPSVRETNESVVTNKCSVHPAWEALIRYCEKLQFGELEKIRIQNGVPMIVEVIRAKIRLVNE
jgi:hypothetical protein